MLDFLYVIIIIMIERKMTLCNNECLFLMEIVCEWIVLYERATDDWERRHYRWDLEWAIKFYEENRSIEKEYIDSFIM